MLPGSSIGLRALQKTTFYKVDYKPGKEGLCYEETASDM